MYTANCSSNIKTLIIRNNHFLPCINRCPPKNAPTLSMLRPSSHLNVLNFASACRNYCFNFTLFFLFQPFLYLHSCTNSIAELHTVIKTFVRKSRRCYHVASEDALESQKQRDSDLMNEHKTIYGYKWFPVRWSKRNETLNNFTNRSQH